MDGVGPGADGEDAAGADDAVDFFDAGGVVGGEVDVCAGEGVADAVGRDVLGFFAGVRSARLNNF